MTNAYLESPDHEHPVCRYRRDAGDQPADLLGTPGSDPPTLDGGNTMARAFTLIEVIVVLVIIGIVAVAGLSVLGGIGHAQVSQSARLLQSGLVGARDRAILTGRPSGIRLLPDPACMVRFPDGRVDFHRLPNGQIDPAYPLYYNRWIPIEEPPPYKEGSIRLPVEPVPLQVSP